MWKLFVAAVAAGIVAAGPCLAAPAAGDASYRLGVGDQVRIRVLEWRSAVGDVHEWSALNTNVSVGPGGNVSLPLLGAIKASGTTTEQLAAAISDRLQSSLKLTIRPRASVEIIKYRPFYILGNVNQPGEYPYRPGMTVLQAVSIAGGMYRVKDAGAVLTAVGDLRVLRLQYDALLARHARLQTELNGAAAVTFPAELEQRKNNPAVAQLIAREQSMFAARQNAERSQQQALANLESLLNSEVGSLQAKMKNVDRELSMLKGEVTNTTALVQRGLDTAPREYTLRQTMLETADQRIDLNTAELRAKEDIEKANQAMVDLRSKTVSEIETDLSDTERKLSQTSARIATDQMIVGAEAGDPGSRATDGPATYTIVRPDNGRERNIAATEMTPVEPGDTIKVMSPVSSTDAAAVDPPPAPVSAPPASAASPAAASPAAASPALQSGLGPPLPVRHRRAR